MERAEPTVGEIPHFHVFSHQGEYRSPATLSTPPPLNLGERLESLDLLNLFAQPPVPPSDDFGEIVGDEGYITDSDPDLMPPLMGGDENWYMRPRIVYGKLQKYSDVVAEKDSTPSDDCDSKEADAAGADGIYGSRQPLWRKDPPGGNCSPCCRCYCTCSVCFNHDTAQIEHAWATGVPIRPHPTHVITRKGIRRQMGPCALASHQWYVPAGAYGNFKAARKPNYISPKGTHVVD
ncbi:hypothetical protein DFH09DRAFT_1301518 [Mycena vulgaris]|nr:hypothetical protein DFH09DRAFT_1301518 [Mycena vulgaris]